jgi:hypothetical protein
MAYLSYSENLYFYYSSKYRTAFKTLGTTILDQNYIKNKIKISIHSGNAYCYSGQDLVFPLWLPLLGFIFHNIQENLFFKTAK